jgi:hypothetical protein
MLAKLDIDHRALFLDMVEGRVRVHGVAAAFRRGSGMLMRRDPSTRALEALERCAGAHLQSVKGVHFGPYDRTPESFALASAETARAEWWVVTYPLHRAVTDICGGDIYMSAQQVVETVEDYRNERYDIVALADPRGSEEDGQTPTP